ncbi:DUF6167 family protein [Streptomyces sp. TRM 70361]|uniref:DUF6167 family protein n=1 Tax=Streptomyces sp. TRM 70361 TaxID=3116553 RepID=UPI002E7B0E70|nr:DUF6167 family protein [Streptomyces sp. TRM 70361]MEE1939043.1 DUF6167 family protein [Streptomyces sp. TRM 70361]
MFRRVFWFGAGAAAGVWATTKVNRKLRALTPESLAARAADQAVAAGHRMREFALDVRAGMAQREGELNDALGLTAADGTAAPAPAAPDRPGLPGGRPRRELGTTHPYDRNEDH